MNGSATLATTYAYDAASRLASISYPSGSLVTYTRNAMGRITTVSAQPPGKPLQAVASSIVYQPFGPIGSLTFANGVAETRTFDLDYRLTHLTDIGAASFQNLTYGYDAANNVKSTADGVTPANSQTFSYDVLNRLVSATGNYGTLGYTYDANGNRLIQTSGAAVTSYSYAPHSNILTAIKTGSMLQTVSTTAAGNIDGFSSALGSVTSLAYNQANRLAATSGISGESTQYTYDEFGHRFRKIGSSTATTLYQYDLAGHLLEETDGQDHARVDYIYLGDRPLATINPAAGKVYYFQDDRLGTPQVVTDASQAVKWATTYQPFGQTSSIPALISQNLRLPGQEFDLETGLNHNGFRDYAPTLGRYLESDPIGLAGGLNTFAYAETNPVTQMDQLGLAPIYPVGLAHRFAVEARCAPHAGETYLTYYTGLPDWVRQLLLDTSYGILAFSGGVLTGGVLDYLGGVLVVGNTTTELTSGISSLYITIENGVAVARVNYIDSFTPSLIRSVRSFLTINSVDKLIIISGAVINNELAARLAQLAEEGGELFGGRIESVPGTSDYPEFIIIFSISEF